MDAKTVLTQWIDAFAARDADALAALYHDDAIHWQVADEPVMGKVQIRDTLARFFRAFPDARTRVETVIAEGEWAAFEWIGSGTFTEDLGAVQATGKRYALRGCGFFRIKDGKIKLQRGYWDKASWYAQIDVPLTVSLT